MSKRKPGRPSKYTEEAAAEICRRISDGKSLRRVCLGEDMPDTKTVLRWLSTKENEAFRLQYAHARELQADALFDEALEIADATEDDWIETDGGKKIDHEHVQRSKLRVDTRKWAAGKLAPKKYGDRLDLKHGGKAIGPVTFVMNLSQDDA